MDKENYNYIMEHDAPKRSLLQLNSKKQRIIFIVVVVLAILLVFMLVLSALSGGNKNSSQTLYPVAAGQADILSITKLGTVDARDIDVINLTATTQAVVSSHSAIINTNFNKDDLKKITAMQNSDAKTTLEEAKQAGTYDKTYTTLLNNQLDVYQQALITAYDAAQSGTLKKDLAKMYNDIKTIRAEPDSPPQDTQNL